jgi:dephospho-CoA kinase
MKKIIALVGPFACGKDVVKKYLENKYQAKSVKFSQILRDVLVRLSLTVNRENLINLSTILRQNFGEDLLAKVIAEDAKNLESGIVILDGARRKSDILYAKDIGGFVLIAIDAELENRYERMKRRNENEGDSQKTFEEFISDHTKETEKTIPDLMKEAKFKIDNNGSLEDLYKKIDEIVEKL